MVKELQSPSFDPDYATRYLNQRVRVKIDRPLGSRHPRFDLVYPVNYGFLPEVMAPDGEELDAYVIGVDRPLDYFEGICIAVVHRIDDNDDKLVLTEPDRRFCDEEILELVDFQERFFKSTIVREQGSESDMSGGGP